jgi:very-short-patch-repair endonuclease
LNNVNQGQWCPYCANIKLCNNNDCDICFDKSFASHPANEYWNTNNPLQPRQVFKSSGNKYFFDCEECHHIFQASLLNVNNGKWCSFCANKILCDNDNCQICFNKSFASHIKSKFWNIDNTVFSRQVFKHDNHKYSFDCNVCFHIFKIGLNNANSGQWCNFCANKILCDNDNCQFCFNKSFASHVKSKYWSTDNKLIPRQVFKHSGNKHFFDCDVCNHTFIASLNNVNNNGTWCPKCVRKTELMIYNFLLPMYKNVIKEARFDWCLKKRFDFVILDLNLIIELDGNGHFEQVSNWGSPEITCENDIYKMKCAYDNGFSMIRIQQDFVYEKKLNWQGMLNKYIKLYKVI